MVKREQTKQNKMGVMPIPSLLFNMSVPLMLSLLFQSLYNIVDSIFVAKISENALTATTLAYPVQILMVASSVGTGVGVAAILSRLIGAKRFDKACEGATVGLLLSLLTSAVFVVLGMTAVDRFASFFKSNEETRQMCAEYLKICMMFCSGIFIETLAQRLLQSVGNTFLSMISLVAGALTNIALDPVLIFGLCGFAPMGIRGAAIATVIGQWLGAAVALFLNLTMNREIHFVKKISFANAAGMAKDIYKVGFPTMITQATGSVMNGAMNIILMPFSQTAVAFFGVYFRLQNFLFMPMNGLGQAVLPIVGFNFGSKSKARLKEVLKAAIPAVSVISLLGTVVFLAIPELLLSLFSASDEMKALGVPALRIISVSFVFGGITMLLGYYASGLGNGIINMLGTAIRQFIVLIPVVILLARMFGIKNVWFAFWISEIAALTCSLVLFIRTFRSKLNMI